MANPPKRIRTNIRLWPGKPNDGTRELQPPGNSTAIFRPHLGTSLRRGLCSDSESAALARPRLSVVGAPLQRPVPANGDSRAESSRASEPRLDRTRHPAAQDYESCHSRDFFLPYFRSIRLGAAPDGKRFSAFTARAGVR